MLPHLLTSSSLLWAGMGILSQGLPAESAARTVAPARAPLPEPIYRWVKVTDKGPFAPRDGAGALVYRGRMWLLGGWNPGDAAHFPRVCNNEVWSSADGAG